MKPKKLIIKNILFAIVAFVLFSGCAKFIEVDPPFTSTSTEQVYAKDATAAASLTSIYIQMSQVDVVPGNGLTSLSIGLGLYADDLNYEGVLGSGNTSDLLWTNQITPTDGVLQDWQSIYNLVYQANAAIEGLNASSTLSHAVKEQLLGEAKFIRAFIYFYLVNMFGDVPLVLGTDYTTNSLLPRTSENEVYTQIVDDLLEAESLLRVDYVGADALTTTPERVRPSKAAAAAMLARVYLYRKDYERSEKYASEVINNTNLYGLDSLDAVFLKNSREAIWQIPSVQTGMFANTPEGRRFILSDAEGNGPAFEPTEGLANCFEMGDIRRQKWIGTGTALNGEELNFIYKYKIGLDLIDRNEYSMVLRVAELYLIRAESRAMQGNISGAQDDLNAIRQRSHLANTTASSQEDLVNAILRERRAELFTEWGHRFMDLKRLDKLDEVLGASKPDYWKSYNKYFPIPQEERDRNPNLSQNAGYN